MEGLIGQTLGQYRIVEPIGEGGMATVYKAYQPGLDRYVAVKVLPPIHAKTPGFSERFLREAKAIAGLHHPNILPLLESGEQRERLCFISPYADGGSLADKFNEGKYLDPDGAVRLARQLAAALDYAHEHNVVHRDIKPGNVLFMEGNT